METVGEATWAHSLKALRPGGRIVICGATSGRGPARPSSTASSSCSCRWSARPWAPATSWAGSPASCEQTGARPLIDRTLPLAEAREGFAAMHEGDLFGKIVFTLP